MIGYDKEGFNYRQLLSLPFNEGVGALAHDVAKPDRTLPMHIPGGGSFTWDNAIKSGCPILEFVTVGGGAGDGVYLDCDWSKSADMDFTTGDYSVACWINWDSTGGWSEIIIGRYGVDWDGWEIYLDISSGLNTVSQRHHHASLTPNLNSNCYSTGWTPGAWHFLGISRIGGNLYPIHYRNGEPLTMSYEDSGMLDPDTCKRDLVIGCRYTKDANWYINQMWNPRVWDRALSRSEWKQIYEIEKHWFY